MKQEEKELLLKDICDRLPYGIKGANSLGYIIPLDKVTDYSPLMSFKNAIYKHGWRPYLFPLSSMTEEQKKELENLGWNFDNFEIHNVSECLGTYREYVAHSDCFTLIDWLNKNHFDYRGLIPKGLALDATGLNIY